MFIKSNNDNVVILCKGIELKEGTKSIITNTKKCEFLYDIYYYTYAVQEDTKECFEIIISVSEKYSKPIFEMLDVLNVKSSIINDVRKNKRV